MTADPVLRHHFRLGLVVTTVDAVNGMDQLDRQPESLKQAVVADRLALTKTDLVTPEVAQMLAARLHRLNPTAPIHRPAEEELDPAALFGNDLFDVESKSAEVQRWFETEERALDQARHGHRHDPNRHGADIEAFALTFERPIDWTAFGLWLSMLLNRHGERILRVKGILAIEGEAAPVAVHGVQHLVHAPIHMARWPGDDRRTRIVFICKGLDAEAIRRSFAAFVLKTPA